MSDESDDERARTSKKKLAIRGGLLASEKDKHRAQNLMMIKINNENFVAGSCSCCGENHMCCSLNVKYQHLSLQSTYLDMIEDCFGFKLIKTGDFTSTNQLICATCIIKLKEAHGFMRQIQKCQNLFSPKKDIGFNIIEPDSPDDAKIQHFLKVEKRVELHNNLKVEREVESGSDKTGVLSVEDVQQYIETHVKYKHRDTFNGRIRMYAPTTKRKLYTKNEIKSFKEAKNNAESNTNNIKTSSTETVKQIIEDNVKKNVFDEKSVKKGPSTRIRHLHSARYKNRLNIERLVECSYVFPFKCRHNNLICFYCGKVVCDPEVLRQHTENHNVNKLRIKTEMVKLEVSRVDCRLCDARIDTLDEFKKHLAIHNKPYDDGIEDSVLLFKLAKDDCRCMVCQKKFPYFHALNRHMNEHNHNFVCDTCGRGFLDKLRFIMHLQTHDKGHFPCESCGKVFAMQLHRRLHVDRMHAKQPRIFCPHCDVKLMTFAQKQKHLELVHGVTVQKHPCGTCGKLYRTRRTMLKHSRSHGGTPGVV